MTKLSNSKYEENNLKNIIGTNVKILKSDKTEIASKLKNWNSNKLKNSNSYPTSTNKILTLLNFKIIKEKKSFSKNNYSRDCAVSIQSWTSETNYSQKLHFKAGSWHKQPPDDQTIQLWVKVSIQFGKLWPTRLCLASSLGGVESFFNKREYSGADWLDLLLMAI